MECWIFGGGYLGDYGKIQIPKNAYIIAADGGLTHVEKLGLAPDLVVGDFDSFKGDLPENCEIIKVPVKKDDTDMMLAVKKAIERGYRKITLCGALGGRLDHTFANIQTLEYISENGGIGRIVSDNNEVYFQKCGSVTYPQKDEWYFSVFAYSDEATVSLKGTLYTLEKYTLKRSFPLGVSNEITAEYAQVTLDGGNVLVIYSKK